MLRRTLLCASFLLAVATAKADLQTYDVDAENGREIVRALNQGLQDGCRGNSYGCSAQLLPSGQILVEAPAAAQAQVATVLKAVAAHRTGPAPRVTLRYWAIVGAPGAADNERLARGPLGPVLQQLKRVHGDLAFKIAGAVVITSGSDAPAKADGGPLEVSQYAHAVGDSLGANIDLLFKEPEQKLHVAVTMKRGEFVVLGEQSAADGASTIFYVVNWSE